MLKQVQITLDRIVDSEQITKYSITKTATNILLAKGRYFFIFGVRIGFHIRQGSLIKPITHESLWQEVESRQNFSSGM